MGNLVYAKPSDSIAPLATITASGFVVGESAAYGLSALVDGNPAKPLHCNATGPIRIVFDFGSAVAIAAMAVPNANLDAGLVCRAELNATDAWGSPTVSVPMPVGADHADGHRASPWAEFHTSGFGLPAPMRYASLYVPANSTNIKIGEVLILAELREFTKHPQWGGTRSVARPFLEHLTTEYAVARVLRRAIRQRGYAFAIKALEQDWQDLIDLADDAGGLARPWFFAPDRAVKTDGGLMVRFTRETAARLSGREEWFEPPPLTGTLMSFPIVVEEVSRSIPL